MGFEPGKLLTSLSAIRQVVGVEVYARICCVIVRYYMRIRWRRRGTLEYSIGYLGHRGMMGKGENKGMG